MGEFPRGLDEPIVSSPMDWAQDPHGSRSWCLALHSLRWVEDPTLALDWVAANPQDSPTTSMAWNEGPVARRGPVLARLADRFDIDMLRESAVEHAEWIADDRNYKARTNHGIAQDEALILLAQALEHPASDAWEQHARERLDDTLRSTIDFDSGFHLEHSPAYQFVIIHMLERLLPLAPEYESLIDRMRGVAGWLVAPGRWIAQIGDSPQRRAPKWTALADGVKQFPGMVAVRHGDSYLLVTCGHHSAMHKHSDDGSFVWFEGEQLVCDTGAYSYDYSDPHRERAVSAQAHNVLVVDGEDFASRGKTPYGDGILDVHEDGDETVIAVSHPHLDGVKHTRTFRHRPGTLVISDHLRASEPHTYTRYLHVPAGLGVEIVDGADVEPLVVDGWTSPTFRERTPTRVHELTTVGRDLTLTASLRAI